MMRVTDRHRQRIGRVVRARIGLRKQYADHPTDLHLLAVTGADDGLLHQVRGVFGNAQPGDRRHQHGDATGLAELQRRARILVDESRLDRGFVRRVFVDHAAQAVVDGEETRGEFRVVVGTQ